MSFPYSDEWEKLHKEVAVLQNKNERLEGEIQTLTLRMGDVEEQRDTLLATNPHVREALHLWAAMPEVCSKLPFAAIIPTGDQGCAMAIRASANKQPFPSRKLEISIMRDPVSAILVARQFFSERCELLPAGATRPDVCA